ncbi:hypothetical protein X551_02993 [Methylibium sp. T29]|nr:hypothetical protein X551_02993 [Methylibium sp. T29]
MALAVVGLEAAEVVAGGRDRQPLECEHRTGIALFQPGQPDRHPPRLPIGPAAHAEQLAADLDERVAATQPLQRTRDGVDRIALGDRRQVDVGAAILACTALLDVELHALPADAAARHLQIAFRRRIAARRVGAEAPEVDRGADGRVVGPTGGARQFERVLQHAEEGLGQFLPAARRGAVVAAQVGVVLPGAHLAHHQVQRDLDRLADLAAGRAGRGRRMPVLHAPAGAHRRPAQLLHGGGQQARRDPAVVAVARQGQVGEGQACRHAAAALGGGRPVIAAALPAPRRRPAGAPWPASAWSCRPWC